MAQMMQKVKRQLKKNTDFIAKTSGIRDFTFGGIPIRKFAYGVGFVLFILGAYP